MDQFSIFSSIALAIFLEVMPFLAAGGEYKNHIKVIGRDYGMDLAQLYITAQYENQRIDDIVAAAVVAA